MVFEFVFPREKTANGFSQYVESLTPAMGLQLVEQCPTATIVEGEWDEAMSFLHRCQEYVLKQNGGPAAVTTIHIHSYA